MGLFYIATACLRHFLQLLLALLDDESSQGPLLGRFSPSAVEMVPVHDTITHESEPSTTLLPSSASHRFNIAANHAAPAAPPSNFKPQYEFVCHTPTRNAKAHHHQQLSKQEPYILGDRLMRAMEEETMHHHHHHHIESSLSFALCQPPCDLPMLLNSELPPGSCTSMSVSSRSSMVSTPVLPSWSPGTPITPTRQPRRKGSAGSGKLVGLGIQILYDGDESHQLDGLGLVPSRMTEPDTVVEEEDLGVPSRILLEEIYNTFTSPEALEAAAPFPIAVKKDLEDEDVFNVAAHGPNAMSTPCKKRSRLSYGQPTAASIRRGRRVCIVERDDEGDESRSSDSSGGSCQRPAWRY